MDRKNWFGRKKLGFGRMPASWQGWLVTLAWIVFLYGALTIPFKLAVDRPTAMLAATVFVVVFTLSFYFIIEAHGDPGPR